MNNTKFIVALVVVIAAAYLWYQRGLVTRDHELCLNAAQELSRQQGDTTIASNEDAERFVDAYTSWYWYCRGSHDRMRYPEQNQDPED